MQELKDVSAQQPELEDKFLSADDMRSITLTPEQLFEIQKTNICDSIMDSMVGVASKNGQHFYATNMLVTIDNDLRNAIIKRFEDLNYKVRLSEKVLHKETNQEYQVLTVSWVPE